MGAEVAQGGGQVGQRAMFNAPNLWIAAGEGDDGMSGIPESDGGGGTGGAGGTKEGDGLGHDAQASIALRSGGCNLTRK